MDEIVDFYAHTRQVESQEGSEETEYELLIGHLIEVACSAQDFASSFDNTNAAYILGLFHDIGKYSTDFQERIRGRDIRVDHSTAGAYLLSKRLWMLSYCVAGHHSGLLDGLSLIDRLTKASNNKDFNKRILKVFVSQVTSRIADNFSSPLLRATLSNETPSNEAIESDYFVKKITKLFGQDANTRSIFGVAMYIRMLFSCLVDADFLCTERFVRGSQREGLNYDSINILLENLNKRVGNFKKPDQFDDEQQKNLAEQRMKVLRDCQKKAARDPGFFKLTVPTGGGKTISSMAFALNHIASHQDKLRRVIVVEPYTSIIEQNAQVYRDIFGNENVIEHHVNFDFGESDCSDSNTSNNQRLSERLKLATENWDAPIVVTTTVQFFESLFANRTSRCRKLHNIAGSVIVLDEAQAIPADFIKPCMHALNELVKNYHCTVVFCTATQPGLEKFLNTTQSHLSLSQNSQTQEKVTEIVSDVEELFTSLKRVTYKDLGTISDEDLLNRLSSHQQALCVVNSRRQAQYLFQQLQKKQQHNTEKLEGIFHLSTYLYPEHRKRVIADITERLSDAKPCIVISTSLIEAGVDLDFPVAYRALTGADSIAQTAGRCNREGKRTAAESLVYVFDPQEKYALPREIEQKKRVVTSVLNAYFADRSEISFDEAMKGTLEKYFRELFNIKDEGRYSTGASGLDKQNIEGLHRRVISKGILVIPFKEIADKAKLIADEAKPVIVPNEAIRADIKALKCGYISKLPMRKIVRYSVGVYQDALKALIEKGDVELIAGNTYLLVNENAYSPQLGLITSSDSSQAIFL